MNGGRASIHVSSSVYALQHKFKKDNAARSKMTWNHKWRSLQWQLSPLVSPSRSSADPLQGGEVLDSGSASGKHTEWSGRNIFHPCYHHGWGASRTHSSSTCSKQSQMAAKHDHFWLHICAKKAHECQILNK